ncbi:hypothetical protein ACTFIY_006134 [Dictyostelium cf. discoideum]
MESCKIRLTKERLSRLSREERIKLAVEYYKENREKVTQSEVGDYYDVPSYEISRYMKNGPGNKHNRILSNSQENQLILELEQIIDRNIPVTKEMAMEMALKLYKDRTGITKETLSDEWWRLFRKDNPSVKLKSVKFQDEARLKAVKELEAPAYWERVWSIVTEKRISPQYIYNVDEKGVVFTKAKKRVIVIEKFDDNLVKENKTMALHKQKQSQHFTMVPWINASGEALDVYYILQMPNTLQMNLTVPKQYGTLYINNSGFMDYELKKKMMIDFLSKLDPNVPKLILLDNHVSNYFEGALELNQKYNVTILTFPANTTHVLQPLDSVPFSSFQARLSTFIVNFLTPDEKGKHKKITPEHYQSLCYTAWRESFTFNNIMQSWAKVGFLNYSVRDPIDKRFSFKPIVQPPNHSNQLVPATTNNQIVVHTPQITKSTIDAMRVNKTLGCEITSTEVSGLITYQFDERKGKKAKSQQNNNLTLVQNNIQINNNNLVQLPTPTSLPTLVESNSTIQKSTSTHSSSCAMPSLDEKLNLFLDSLKKKK